MNDDLIICGDSHALFFTQSFREYDEFKSIAETIFDNVLEGSFRKKILDKNIYIIWKTGKTAFNADFDLFEELFNKFDIESCGSKKIVFQFGTNDLIKKAEEYNNAEEIVKKYIYNIDKICKKYELEPIVMMPIVHKMLCMNQDLNKQFFNLLRIECKKYNMRDPINIFDIIDEDFITADWDRGHLPSNDSLKALEYLIKSSFE